MSPTRTAILAFALLAGCDRPKPLSAPPEVRPVAAENETRTVVPSSAVPAPVPTRETPAILRDYRAQGDAGKRRELIWELNGVRPDAAVAALGEMLDTEKHANLRVELFDALDLFDGQESAKLAILKRELLDRRTVGEAHDAAIDALLNIQHRDAIPLWQALAENADDELRDIARNAIKSLDTPK